MPNLIAGGEDDSEDDDTSGERSEFLRRWQEDQDVDALNDLLAGEIIALGSFLRSSTQASRDDITQAAIFKLLKRLGESTPPRFDSTAELRSYLIGAARNLLIDRLRKSGREFHEVDLRASQGMTGNLATTGGMSEVERKDAHRALEIALNLLKAAFREILVLHYLKGWPVKRIADHLGISEEAARMRLTRARRALRRKLEHWNDPAEEQGPEDPEEPESQ